MNTQSTSNRGPFRNVPPTALAVAVGLLGMISAQAWQEPRPQEPAVGPWGISSSAGSTRNVTEWFPKMSAAGVTTVRLFPEWRDFEPTKGTWQWERADALVDAAAKNKIEINAILMGSSPSDKKIHAFPMDNLDGWSNFVSTVVGRYKKRIHCWEVWNEGNGGFNDGKHTTTDYAKLAVATYAAAKKADAHAQVGLSVASFDAPYLNQAILAMAKEGKPNSFDFLCIHPYEIADHLGEPNGEIPFLWMTRLLRDMLKASAPERADAEIWITEVARRVEKRKGHAVSEQDAARALAKIYTMAIAQGIARTQWFEAQDPVGEDQGFGLLSRNGAERASYTTFKTLTTYLGPAPKYLGWLALGQDGKGYGFVFQGEAAPILAAWMPAGQSDKTLAFTNEVKAIDTLSGVVKAHAPGQPFTLTDTPVLLTNLPAELLKREARVINAGKNFPLGRRLFPRPRRSTLRAGQHRWKPWGLSGSACRQSDRQVRGRLHRHPLARRHWPGRELLRPSVVREFPDEGVFHSCPRSPRCARQRRHESQLRGRRQSGPHSLQESRPMVRPDGGRRLANVYLARHRCLLRQNVGIRL